MGFSVPRRPIVLHLQPEPLPGAPRADGDPPRVRVAGDAVAYRVLRQRLEGHPRNHRLHRVCRDVVADGQAVGEPRPFDFQISLHKADLVGQGRLMPVAVAERAAQQLTQRGKRVRGRAGAALADQRGDGVQRVEQEVRLELRL